MFRSVFFFDKEYFWASKSFGGSKNNSLLASDFSPPDCNSSFFYNHLVAKGPALGSAIGYSTNNLGFLTCGTRPVNSSWLFTYGLIASITDLLIFFTTVWSDFLGFTATSSVGLFLAAIACACYLFNFQSLYFLSKSLVITVIIIT